MGKNVRYNGETEEKTMDEKKRNKLTAIIRAAICVAVMVVVALGWLDIIPSHIGVIISSALLAVVSIWNAVEAFRDKRKGAGIFNIVMTAIIITLCVISMFL